MQCYGYCLDSTGRQRSCSAIWQEHIFNDFFFLHISVFITVAVWPASETDKHFNFSHLYLSMWPWFSILGTDFWFIWARVLIWFHMRIHCNIFCGVKNGIKRKREMLSFSLRLLKKLFFFLQMRRHFSFWWVIQVQNFYPVVLLHFSAHFNH